MAPDRGVGLAAGQEATGFERQGLFGLRAEGARRAAGVFDAAGLVAEDAGRTAVGGELDAHDLRRLVEARPGEEPLRLSGRLRERAGPGRHHGIVRAAGLVDEA